jgi:hypothetical protein
VNGRHAAMTLRLLPCLIAFPVALGAQDSVVVAPGVRVRLSTDSIRLVGNLVRRVEDSITILDARSHAAHVLSLNSVRVFEISRGRTRRTGRGAWIGLLSGAGAGLVSTVVLCRNGCASSGGDFSGLIALALTGAGAVGGAGVGALIGSQIRSERWDRAAVSGIRVGLIPTWSRQPGVGLRITWSPGARHAR